MHDQNMASQRQPLSGAKHFWLSFLAVVTGVPAALAISATVMFAFVVFVAVLIAAASGSGQTPSSLKMDYVYGDSASVHRLVSIPVHGVILSGASAEPLQSIFGKGYTDGERVKEQLRVLAKDKTVDGIILEIDSPGGMITASKAMADGVAYYRDTAKKPIISHINGMGASGAYWAASATDAIYAEEGSEAGSIGVIMGPIVTTKGVVSYGGVTTNVPMTFKYFTAGRSKDLGSPYRDITAEEETFLNSQIQTEYEKFVAQVSGSRGIPADIIKNEVGALAYGTDSAIKLKLIDGASSKEQAYEELAMRAKVKTSFQVMRLNSSLNVIGSLFGAKSLIQVAAMSSSERSAARARFCETSLISRPLVYAGDVSAVCR